MKHADHELAREALSTPVSAEEANTQYEKIYDSIKSAKEKADITHKRLVILIGENHIDRRSLLMNLMIVDAAHRLGIKHAVLENMREDDTSASEDMRQHAHNMSNAVLSKMAEIGALSISGEQKKLLEEYQQLSPKELADIDASLLFIADAHYHKPEKSGQHGHIATVYMEHSGYLTLVGDPLRDQFENRYNRKLEGAMVASVQHCTEPCIAEYGVHHLAPLYSALKKDPSIELLAFNTSHLEKRPLKLNIIIRQARLHLLEKATERPRVKGLEPTEQQAMLLAVQASIAHRVKTGEMDKKWGKMLSEMSEAVNNYTNDWILSGNIEKLSDFTNDYDAVKDTMSFEDYLATRVKSDGPIRFIASPTPGSPER